MGRNVTITGGAGSLGRAFVRLLQADHRVTVIDSSEWACAELRAAHPNVRVVLGDFASADLSEEPPDDLIHCAAYKHVGMGEEDPAAFIDNNLTKTARLFRQAYRLGSGILFVSTDKAVEPVSAYGMTKALGERLALQYGGSVARLGNILGSSGSVIPVWEAAIAEKRPITVTDERMRRWTIDDRDAAHQVWQQYREGKRLCIPEGMEEVRVLDLMAEVLRRHGYAKASDYLPGVELVGMRPGEKLAEKLRWDHEQS